MAINVSVQYNGVEISPTTVDPMLLPLGNPFKCRENVLSFQSMITPTTKRFDISPPCLCGMLLTEGLDAFRFFFKQLVVTFLH